jgi:hypothetical protein
MVNATLPIEVFEQLNTEWLILHMLREAFALAEEGWLTYDEVLVHAMAIAPRIFASDSRLLLLSKTSLNAATFERMAQRSQMEEKGFTAVDAVKRELDQVKSAFSRAQGDTKDQEDRLNRLKSIRAELQQKDLTETQAIMRDTYQIKRTDIFQGNIDTNFSGAGYNEYKLPNDRGMRVRCTHPDPPEWSMGGDMIYEHHDLQNERVRIAVLQYKMWDGKKINRPPSEAERMNNQLARLENAFCNPNICQKEITTGGYRMPLCTAFFRPTDQLQSLESRHASSGYHIPVCQLAKMWEETGMGGHRIPKERMRGSAVSANIFEEMFNGDQIGSDWMTYDELRSIYEQHSLLDPGESVFLHVQTMPLPASA